MRPMKSWVRQFLNPVISGNFALTSIMVFTAILSAANGSHPTNDAETKKGAWFGMGANSTA